jgi:hypothetical protein
MRRIKNRVRGIKQRTIARMGVYRVNNARIRDGREFRAFY